MTTTRALRHSRSGRWLGRLPRTFREPAPLLELRLNFLRPVRRLVAKERVGARTRKRYDLPLTPYRRMLATGSLATETIATLEAQYHGLNPADLQRHVDRLLDQRWDHAVRQSERGRR